MTITFRVLRNLSEQFNEPKQNLVLLEASNWDDYYFKTSFQAIFYNENGEQLDLGTVKIGYINQKHGWTLDKIPNHFESLSEDFFSLGQDVEYYQRILELAPENKDCYLRGLNDIVANENIFKKAQNEQVLSESLMRGVSLSAINGQFRRVLNGEVMLTDFKFAFRASGDDQNAAIDLDFHVEPASKPSTNVHVLIGRNGIGKTTLLDKMVNAIICKEEISRSHGCFYEIDHWNRSSSLLSSEYFSSVVSVSFSAFDKFIPPPDQPDRARGVAYFYIGMKRTRIGDTDSDQKSQKTDTDLIDDFIESLKSCLSQPAKRNRWLTAIKRLESDSNFADMALGELLDINSNSAIQKARSLAEKMSSGHSIVLLTITKLVDTVEEKTLVLMDEPESHLHPPLLSAFTRAISDLLHNRNGVAIIATHSPVVVQEVPRSCVWKLTRLGNEGRSDRPERETFGENVGVLTREIFGLEVTKSGFHDMLQQAVNEGGTFESIMEDYNGQLGFEAQGILRVLITARDAANISSQ